MNLFFLDIDPKKSAMYHCDKHVIKMILEIVQMLYTAHNMLNSTNLPTEKEHGFTGYRSFNPRHPTCIWIRQCVENYNYAAKVAKCLCEEYTYRYNKIHTCEKHVHWLIENVPNNFHTLNYTPETYLSYNKTFQSMGYTPVPLAMYDDTKYQDTFKSYRFYYIVHKRRFATWKKRPVPWWFTSGNYKLIKNNDN